MSRDYLQHGRRHTPHDDPIPGVWRASFGQVAEATTAGPNSDGIQDPGSGDWTVSGDDAGNWTVTFNTPFESLPTILTSENETTTSPPSFVQITSVTTGSFGVTTYELTGLVSDDVGFNFIAIGT